MKKHARSLIYTGLTSKAHKYFFGIHFTAQVFTLLEVIKSKLVRMNDYLPKPKPKEPKF